MLRSEKRMHKGDEHELSGKTRDCHGIEFGHRSGDRARTGARGGRCGAELLYRFSDEDHALARDRGKEFGVAARYIQADMSKPDQCRALIETAGGLRYSGQQRRHPACRPIDEFPTEKWDAIIAINLNSAFHTTAAALPMMRKAGWGRMVNIASAHG
jgi:3-hydroxybutyrate dehydrogenase